MKIAPIMAIIGAATLSGCAHHQAQKKAPTSQSISYSYSETSLAIDNAAKQVQSEEAIRASCTSGFSEPVYKNCKFYKSDDFLSINLASSDVDIVTVPTVSRKEFMSLKFELTNLTQHSIRLQGSGLIVKVNGTNFKLSDDDYSMLQSTILGGDSIKFDIDANKLQSLPANSTVTVVLHDVVVAVNDAGEPTKRRNFQWVYKLNQTPKTITKNIVYATEALPNLKVRNAFVSASQRSNSPYLVFEDGQFTPCSPADFGISGLR